MAAKQLPAFTRFIDDLRAVWAELPDDESRMEKAWGLMETLLASSIWFIGGLALFLTLAGAMGSLVSRQEEAGSVVVPLTMILVVGYLAALSAGDSTLGTVLAYFPLTSPMVVPYRVAVEAGSIVEYALSAVLLYATVFAAARIGAIVFRRAIVRTGRRLTLREVLR